MQHVSIVVSHTVKQFFVRFSTQISKRWQVWRDETTSLIPSDKCVESLSIGSIG